jgi:hypothetical protein
MQGYCPQFWHDANGQACSHDITSQNSTVGHLQAIPTAWTHFSLLKSPGAKAAKAALERAQVQGVEDALAPLEAIERTLGEQEEECFNTTNARNLKKAISLCILITSISAILD